MIVTAHQPLYLPWSGFIHKVALADKFCVLDDVQFADRDFIHRNRIASQTGSPRWLTIPVDKKNHRLLRIKDVKVMHHDWALDHLERISSMYSNYEYFKDYFTELKSILLSVKSTYLIDFTMPVMLFLLKEFHCDPEIVFSSELGLTSKKSDLVLEITTSLSGTKYLSGANGKDYIDVKAFEKEGIEVHFQDYKANTTGKEVRENHQNLSSIDILFTYGPKSRECLFKNNIKNLENYENIAT
jgi:hypothetical protein